jgi:hypothetical protein
MLLINSNFYLVFSILLSVAIYYHRFFSFYIFIIASFIYIIILFILTVIKPNSNDSPENQISLSNKHQSIRKNEREKNSLLFLNDDTNNFLPSSIASKLKSYVLIFFSTWYIYLSMHLSYYYLSNNLSI